MTDDPRGELGALVGDLRRALGHLQRGGVFAVPGGRSPSPAAVDAAEALEPRGEAARSAATASAAAIADPRASAAAIADPGASAAPVALGRRTLAQVREELGDCQRCKLARTRQKIVFGVGAPDAALLFVGEAPGAEEDRRGEPFVGAAGQLLDKMIGAMGWSRETVHIANVLKCRPPGNRDPEPDEVAECSPFLAGQIAAIAPRVIVTLGRPAAHALLGTTAPISKLRGRWQEYQGIRVMPTFHPAYLLRSPDKKREAWSDLKLVMDELARLGVAVPTAPRG